MLLFSPKKEDRLRVSKRFFLERNKEEMTRGGVKEKSKWNNGGNRSETLRLIKPFRNSQAKVGARTTDDIGPTDINFGDVRDI